MIPLGRWLLIAGVLLIVVGALLSFTNVFSYLKLGRLPGDFHVKRDNFQLYFPLTTCIIISLVLTLLFYLFKR